MRAFFGVGLAIVSVLLFTGCAEDSEPTRPIDFLPITAIIIESQHPQIANLTTNQFTAKGDFSGVFTRDVTLEAIWSVNDPNILTIDPVTGFASALNPGSVTVTATMDDVSADFEFTVTDAVIAQIDIDPAAAELPLGMTLAFRAIGTFSDQTVQELSRTVVWSSNDTNIATIDADGIARGVTPGITSILATFQETVGEALLTVKGAVLESIAIEPEEVVLAPTDTFQLRANGFFSDDTVMNITNQVQWSSSGNQIATISETGVVTALASGETTITATRNSHTSSIPVTVATLESITISVAEEGAPVVGVGQTIRLIATGNFSDNLTMVITQQAEWSVQVNPAVASVSNQEGEKGVVTGEFPGFATVRAVRSGIFADFQVFVE